MKQSPACRLQVWRGRFVPPLGKTKLYGAGARGVKEWPRPRGAPFRASCAIIPARGNWLRQALPRQNRQVGRVSLRILIVDDDLSMRMLLAEYFRRLGFEVEEKESAEEALEHAVSGRFDCFIFDVSMPGMSGLELLKRVRDRGVETPAMFLTAHDAVDDKVAGFQAGADDYLAKPFSPRELEVRV